MSSFIDASGNIHSSDTGRFTGHLLAEGSTDLLEPATVPATHDLAPVLAAVGRLLDDKTAMFDSLAGTVMLHEGHAYCTDTFVAMRIRTPLAEDADQVSVPAAEVNRALRHNPDRSCRLRAGGTLVEVGGQPIVPIPPGTAADPLRHIPAMFERHAPTAEPATMTLADLGRTVRAVGRGDCELDGWGFSSARLRKAAAALRVLGAKDCTVDRMEFTKTVRRGRTVQGATLRLAAPGVEILLQSRIRAVEA